MDMKYIKCHGLGNDYLVIRPEDAGENLGASQIRCVCHRNYGVGSWDSSTKRRMGIMGARYAAAVPLAERFFRREKQCGAVKPVFSGG